MNVALGFCSAFEANGAAAVILPLRSALEGKLAQAEGLTYIPAVGISAMQCERP
ncbi:hypothetical protein [Mesorhizobium sp.]|uniref:hypothetical protein n=1 Tax=Mesorhizobium sp. TaxID=1871066 RepID=UPI0025E3E5A5|nr:hypothetical protein [Mesorhizobium sp.]